MGCPQRRRGIKKVGDAREGVEGGGCRMIYHQRCEARIRGRPQKQEDEGEESKDERRRQKNGESERRRMRRRRVL